MPRSRFPDKRQSIQGIDTMVVEALAPHRHFYTVVILRIGPPLAFHARRIKVFHN